MVNVDAPETVTAGLTRIVMVWVSTSPAASVTFTVTVYVSGRTLSPYVNLEAGTVAKLPL